MSSDRFTWHTVHKLYFPSSLLKSAFLDGRKNNVYCTLSILAFWQKCCYYDWRYFSNTLAPSAGVYTLLHTLQYVDEWAMTCVDVYDTTTWSIPASVWRLCAHLLVLRKSWMRCFLFWNGDLVLKTQQVIGPWKTAQWLPFYSPYWSNWQKA